MPLATVWYHAFEGGSPSSLELALDSAAFSLSIRDGRATFVLKHSVSSLDEAERRTNEFLRSWTADVALQSRPMRVEFHLGGCEAPGLGGYACFGGTATVTPTPESIALARLSYPWRFHPYLDLPLISSLITRYEEYRLRRERLIVLGFLCLSALETTFGKRRGLASECRIDFAVLNELGRLVSTVGSYSSARKVHDGHDFRDYTSEETHWIETVIRELLIRAGERLHDRTPDSVFHSNRLPSRAEQA